MKSLVRRLVIIVLVMVSSLTYGEVLEPRQEKAKEQKVLYLTFDDGPSSYTKELLDLLKSHHMQATFFMLKDEMEAHADVVRRMIEEGHAVGLHGVSHEKNQFYCGQEGPVKEMDYANAVLEKITGQRTRLVRTPYGSAPYLTQKQYERLCSHDYILWDWNIDSRDWSYRNPSRTYLATSQMIKKSKCEPKVVLFHDIKYVVPTMQLFIEWMEENGYTSQKITPELPPVRLGVSPHH